MLMAKLSVKHVQQNGKMIEVIDLDGDEGKEGEADRKVEADEFGSKGTEVIGTHTSTDHFTVHVLLHSSPVSCASPILFPSILFTQIPHAFVCFLNPWPVLFSPW